MTNSMYGAMMHFRQEEPKFFFQKSKPLPPIKTAVIGWAVSCQLREGGGGGRAPTGQREANSATVLTLQEHIVILNCKIVILNWKFDTAGTY